MTLTQPDETVRCTRCKNKHRYSERYDKEKKMWGTYVLVSSCPRCGGESFNRDKAPAAQELTGAIY